MLQINSLLNMTQIWLSHYNLEPHSHCAKWTHRPNIFAHIYQNITKGNRCFTYCCQICARNKYAPQMPYIYMPHLSITSCSHESTMLLHIPCMNSLQSTVQPGIMLYKHFTLLTYVPQQMFLSHQTCMSHCSNTLLYM